jgi:membrane protease YdiL (CAAX protease family)
MAEELSLRGYIQPKLEARCGKWPGLVLTALLFSVLHLPKIFLRQASPPVLLVVAFIFGIVFGFIRDKTNSIYYPVLCHGAINLIVFFTSGS